jgi:hypothetical protein
MKLSSVSVSMVAVAILAGSVALWPASAQPTGQPTDKPASHPTGEPPARPAGPRGDRPNRQPSEWQEKLKDEVREHPRLGRALVALHEAKDYLDKATGDLGGHKASSIKACDDAIKELTEAIKFDEKRDDSKGRPGRGKPEGEGKPPSKP